MQQVKKVLVGVSSQDLTSTISFLERLFEIVGIEPAGTQLVEMESIYLAASNMAAEIHAIVLLPGDQRSLEKLTKALTLLKANPATKDIPVIISGEEDENGEISLFQPDAESEGIYYAGDDGLGTPIGLIWQLKLN